MLEGDPRRSDAAADACPEEDVIAGFLAGTASADESTAVEAHLDECGACRALLAAMLRAAPEATVEARRRRGASAALPLAAALEAPPIAPPPARGDTIGRYVVEDVLGVGGMGVVYAAHDPALDRHVALKLLRPELSRTHGAGEVEHRLLREAQAMARLAHPSVIAVHDVGEHRGQVFVAMELVEGRTLRAWLGERERTWRVIVELYMRAAQGLSAAHAAGLVHRDFKPDNVLVGVDGRVRVTDFGLARSADGSDTVDSVGELADGVPAVVARVPSGSARGVRSPFIATVTMTGVLVGTPAYMGPEQHRGAPATPRSDQFSFCVALYEALYGERPFAGQTAREIADAVVAGAIREAPRGARVPRSLRRIVVRGLAADPAARWPSIDALLAALGRVLRARRRWLELGAATLAATAIVALLVLRGGGGEGGARAVCATAPERLAGAWDAERAATLGAAFAGGARDGDRVAQRVRAIFDAYGRRLVAARVEACEATHVRREQSADLLDLRMHCLDRRRAALGALVDVLTAAPGETAEHAIAAASSLPAIEDCEELAPLTARVRPPADAAVRARIAEAETELARVEALRDAGRYAEGVAAGRALLDRVIPLAYRPLEAEASYALAQLHERNGEYPAAEELLDAAVQAAEAGRHDELAALAWTYMIYAIGYRQTRFDEGHRAADHAAAVIERLGGSDALEARRLGMLGILEDAEGQHEAARRHLEQAIALCEKAAVPQTLLVPAIDALGMALTNLGRIEEARVQHERALALNVELLGPDSPEVAYHHDNLATVDFATGRLEDARAHFERALAIRRAVLSSDHPDIGLSVNNVGLAMLVQGDAAGALVQLREAERIFSVRSGTMTVDVGRAVMNQGDALRALGKLDDAHAAHGRALAMWEQALGADHVDLATVLGTLAEDELQLGRFAEALAHLQRAVALMEKALGEGYSEYAYHERAMGEAYLGLGDAAKAVAHLDDALTRLRADAGANTDPEQVAVVQWVLAGALWKARQRSRAVAEADAARAWYAAAAGDAAATNAREIATWLETHR